MNVLFILFKILWILPPGLYLFKKNFMFCQYFLRTIRLKILIRLILKKFIHEFIFHILFFYLYNFPLIFRAIRILNICLWLFLFPFICILKLFYLLLLLLILFWLPYFLLFSLSSMSSYKSLLKMILITS